MRRGPVLEGDPALPPASWTTPDTTSLLPRVPVWEGHLLGPRSTGASLPGFSTGSGPWCAASRFLQLPILELLKTTSRQVCLRLVETTSQSPPAQL